MIDSAQSFPDGVTNYHAFSNAIKHFACQDIFSMIEDGMEGRKTNTEYHSAMYDKFLQETDQYCRRVTGAQAIAPMSQGLDSNMFA